MYNYPVKKIYTWLLYIYNYNINYTSFKILWKGRENGWFPSSMTNMSMIIINGRVIHAEGSSVSIINGKVRVNGKQISNLDEIQDKEVNISISGVQNLEVDYCTQVNLTGNAKSVRTQSGDIQISGNVDGDVSSMSGGISCGDVAGNVRTASGDVECGNVTGNVNTVTGDISRN